MCRLLRWPKYAASSPGSTRPDEDIRRVVGIVQDRGGIHYARDQAHLYAERAVEVLLDLPEDLAVEALQSAVAYAVGRDR